MELLVFRKVADWLEKRQGKMSDKVVYEWDTDKAFKMRLVTNKFGLMVKIGIEGQWFNGGHEYDEILKGFAHLARWVKKLEAVAEAQDEFIERWVTSPSPEGYVEVYDEYKKMNSALTKLRKKAGYLKDGR